MSDKTPKNAKWIPQANGYVSNGQVVSTKPQYDSSGKFLEEIGGATSTASNTQNRMLGTVDGATWSPEAGGYVKNGQVVSTTPVYGAMNNVAGSNTDKNSVATQAGSMGSLNNNTEKAQLSPMQTTVTQGVTPPDPYTAWINQYNEHVAQNNLKGQVEDLTQLSNMGIREVNGQKTQDLLARAQATNVPQVGTQEQGGVSGITGQPMINPDSEQAGRIQQAMQNINDRTITSYERRINNAKLDGDLEKAELLQNELDQFYAANGISPVTSQSASTTTATTAPAVVTPQQEYETKMAEIDEKYDNAIKAFDVSYHQMYAGVLNDVTNGIMAQIGNLMNFQYDPTKDRALHVAQGYAQAQVKETMNATGMYYSTMTQSAITKAVAELVPVYEKMAKQEAQENLQMLYNLGNYLMNLEQQQFNMWKTQVDYKIQEMEQKRKDVAQAWDRANNLGYIDNQASAILGIEAGTLTYKARKDAQDRQDAIDKELRGYQQQEIMARLNHSLDMEKLREQSRLDIEKLQEQNRLQKDYYSSISGTGVTYRTGTMNASAMEDYFYNLIDNSGYTDEEAIEEALNNAKGDSERRSFLASIGEDPNKWLGTTATTSTPIDTSGRKKEYPSIGETARNSIVSEDVLSKLDTYYATDNTTGGLRTLIRGMQSESSEAGNINDVLNDVIILNPSQGFNKVLEGYTNNFSEDWSDSTGALNQSLALIEDYLQALKDLGIDDSIRATYADSMYTNLIDKVADAQYIDMTMTDFAEDTKDLKWRAGQEIAKAIETPTDESLNEVKADILSHINEKLPAPAKKPETTNNKTKSGLPRSMYTVNPLLKNIEM